MAAKALLRASVVFAVLAAVQLPVLAQDLDQPPQAPPPSSTSNVNPPAGTSAPGQQGETPHEVSEPPTGYTGEQKVPTIRVTGGVNVPVSGDTLRLDADSWRVEMENGEATVVTAKGHVKAVFGQFTVASDAARADLRTKLASFSGHVVFTADKQPVMGEALSFNLDTREWKFESARTTVLPEMLQGQIQAPIFISGGSIAGIGQNVIEVENGGFTTCNLETPHYFISAKSATLWTDRKLIARDATFLALGRTILKLSRIAVPIPQLRDRPSIIPRVGQTQEEGLFMKAAYGFAASQKNTGNLKLDLMSKKGVGIGVTETYTTQVRNGNLNLYYLSDLNRNLNTLTGRFTHNQKFGGIDANWITDYRANSYQYSPQSTSLANELRLSRQNAAGSSTLAMRSSSDSGFGSYSRLSSNFSHSQRLSQHSFGRINLDYFRSETPLFLQTGTVNAASAQLNSRLDYTHQAKSMDWALRFSKIDDLSSEAFINQSGSRFAGTERLPELELTSSAERLGTHLPLGLPAQLGLAVGRYREDLGRVEEDRAVANVSVPSRVYNLADKLNLMAGGGFRQYFYSDGTAQYAIDTALSLNRKVGEHSSASLDYRYLRPRGFSPFRFDFVGRYNTLSGRYNLQETEKFKLSLFSGYNFGQKDYQWQDLTLRMTYAPTERFLIYTSTGYNLNQSQWRSLVNQFRFRLPRDFKLDLGTRYDIERSKFESIKGVLDTPVGTLWHIRANAGYNGYTKDFDYRNIQIVRDLHCWEMSLSYVDQRGFWQEKGLRLNFRIKAFPLFDRFGVGQFGQTLDTSVGEVL